MATLAPLPSPARIATPRSAQVSAFVGWIHSSPPLFYLADACLRGPELQKLYAGRRFSSLAIGMSLFFLFGQAWECFHPNTIEVYCAPEAVWRARGRAFGRALGLDAERLSKREATIFRLGEDVAWSWTVKSGGVLGGAVAVCLFDALVLRRRAKLD